MYRYWDGNAWSAATSPIPTAAPPSSGIGSQQPTQPGYGQQYGEQGYGHQGYGQRAYGQQPGSAYTNYQQAASKKTPIGWWIGGAALVLVLVLVGVFAVRAISNSTGGGGNGPGGTATTDVCPPEDTKAPTPVPQPNDGRVHGGQLSYPMLPPPWSAPRPDDRVPFGRGVLSQTVTIEPNYDGLGRSWVASVIVGELLAGDGFFSPQQGSEIVAKCVIGRFYGNAEVGRDDLVNKAITVDGKEAWEVESHLTFDIPKLKTKGELMIIVIVKTSATASSLFYASIPDTSPGLVQPARDTMKSLKVTS